LEEQRTTFGAVYSTLTNTNDDRSFESQAFLRGLGARVSRRAISNEKDLEHFQHNSVEDPVRSIVQRLTEEEAFRHEFDVGDGIIFENHPSAISDVAEEVVERQGPPVTPPRTPGPDQLDRSQLRPDQICVYMVDEQSSLRNMAYVMEYKAPHKLTPVHMRAGLHSMDIHKQVVNRATVPTADDQEALFQYHAERLATAAITQTYHYMIESGLEYGLLTTGETIVFLKIDWQDPGTLYFHLAEPGPEALAHREEGANTGRMSVSKLWNTSRHGLRTMRSCYDLSRLVREQPRPTHPHTSLGRTAVLTGPPTSYDEEDASPMRRLKTSFGRNDLQNPPTTSPSDRCRATPRQLHAPTAKAPDVASKFWLVGHAGAEQQQRQQRYRWRRRRRGQFEPFSSSILLAKVPPRIDDTKSPG
jgi:hypothetical protein